LKDWDSGLLTFLIKVNQFCFQNKIQFEAQGLPEGARRLLQLARHRAGKGGRAEKVKKEVLLDLIGAKTFVFWRSTVEMVDFLEKPLLLSDGF